MTEELGVNYTEELGDTEEPDYTEELGTNYAEERGYTEELDTNYTEELGMYNTRAAVTWRCDGYYTD